VLRRPTVAKNRCRSAASIDRSRVWPSIARTHISFSIAALTAMELASTAGVVSHARRYAAKGRTGRRETCCLRTVWLANPCPQELPDLLGGLGCLGGAEHDRVDMGQALADLQDDVDPGFGCCCGQAFGIAEQQVGRADLDKQRREPGQGGEQRRRSRAGVETGS